MDSIEETCTKLLGQIDQICLDSYDCADTGIIESVLRDVVDLFRGKRRGFQKADTRYHDLSHTLQTVTPFIEIIDGHNRSNCGIRVSRVFFDLGVIAVLLHDTGYIKEEGDTIGTGAKFTFTHVKRSSNFAVGYLAGRGLGPNAISSVLKAIACTGVAPDHGLHFDSKEEELIGHALGTADYLGQMSAPDYLARLPILYEEFAEAYRHEGIERLRSSGAMVFTSADHLIKSTPGFWEKVVPARFQEMGLVYKHISNRYEDGQNPYLKSIDAHIRRIRELYP